MQNQLQQLHDLQGAQKFQSVTLLLTPFLPFFFFLVSFSDYHLLVVLLCFSKVLDAAFIESFTLSGIRYVL